MAISAELLQSLVPISQFNKGQALRYLTDFILKEN